MILPHDKSFASLPPEGLQRQEQPLVSLPGLNLNSSSSTLIDGSTFQRESALSLAILAISGHTMAFSLASAAGSANTIGPNALLKF